MFSVLRRLLENQRAVTAIEYALIICLISGVAIVGFSAAGKSVLGLLGPAGNALN